MWRYNSPDELYHYGILGMRWGHRKQKIGQTLVKTIDASSNYIKRDVKNFLHINKDSNKKFVSNNVKKYGKNISRIVSVGYHVLGIYGSAITAKWFWKYGTKKISELTKEREVEKWRKNAAYAMISLPVLYYGYNAIKTAKVGIKEQKQINNIRR